ncbi:Energy-coupling factor transporter transmembrane protein EcfT [compost metagenome]
MDEGKALLQIGSWTLYSEGFSKGLITALRMFLLVSFTAILTFTTTPGLLNQGMSGVLKPLEKVGLSAERLTLMMSIALRFIPTILDETHKIVKAQAARGADLKELPWKEKGKLLVSLLVPVTVSAFRRAEDLVLSMESRGYLIGAPRSEYHLLVWRSRDTWFIFSYIVLVAVVITLRFI